KHRCELGNSVIVGEHDHDAICAADYIVDMGPGAGEHGGQVVAQGTRDEIRLAAQSLTGQYLAGHRQIPMPTHRLRADPARILTITGATGNNLREVTLNLPVGLFVCVTGVSGSGKSTLINDTLYHAAARALYGSTTEPAPFREMIGLEYYDKVISVDQAFAFFEPVPAVARKLSTLLDVGLGYITLGQSATTLSGGEAQRVKLALELSKRDTGRTLYILDEPTTGLHFHDIEMLL